MASPHELSGGEPNNPYEADVLARTVAIGDYYHAQRAAEWTKEITELADKYPDLINRNEIEFTAELEGTTAGEQAMRRREAGLMNDMQSKAPGIFVTGQLDYAAFSEMEEHFRMDGVPYDLSVPDRRYPYAAYNLHLPFGAFKCMIEEGLQVQQHLMVYGWAEFKLGDNPDFRPVGGGAHLLTGGYLMGGHTRVHGTIGRIEGARGTLWQNPNTNPDGSPDTIRRS